MRFSKKTLFLFLCSVWIPASLLQAQQKPLLVAAAANVQFAVEELKTVFEKETGIPVQVILGASGKLTVQIEKGAPFHVFISADSGFPQKLFEEKLAEKPEIYAYGTLVLWSMESGLTLKIPKIFQNPAIKKIVVANPETAPYGKAAVETLKALGLLEEMKEKLVYGESISQVNHYITIKAAQMGFTAKSIVVSPEMKGKGVWIEVPSQYYQPIIQSAAILKKGSEEMPVQAEKFYRFLLSKKGKKILKSYGFQTP